MIGEKFTVDTTSVDLTSVTSDALLIDATLNCLSIIVRTRQTVATKVVSEVLKFNPFKRVNGVLSSKAKVHIRSMEKTVRAFLMNIQRRSVCGVIICICLLWYTKF